MLPRRLTYCGRYHIYIWVALVLGSYTANSSQTHEPATHANFVYPKMCCCVLRMNNTNKCNGILAVRTLL
jgi:hypothetical protein